MNPSAHHKKLKGDRPCDDCPEFNRCKVERKACIDFIMFVETGRLIATSRKPSRAAYCVVFNDEPLTD